MIKIKKLLSACLATAMLFSMSITASATELTYDGVAHGDYIVDVAYLNVTDPSLASAMAGYMVGTTVPVTVDANGYTFTMDIYNYFAKSDVLALSDMKYSADKDVWGDAVLTLENVADEYSTMTNAKYYERVTFTVDSLDDFYMQAFIIPMAEMQPAASTPSWLVQVDEDTLRSGTASAQGMSVSASVEKNVATTTVTIPASTDMGELSKTQDTTVNYTVSSTNAANQTVTVTADATVTLTDGAASLAIANAFDGVNGTLTATAADVAGVATDSDLNLSGALRFYVTIAIVGE